jgi:hypothetical protein
MAVGTANLTVEGLPEIHIDLRDSSKLLGSNGTLRPIDVRVNIRNKGQYGMYPQQYNIYILDHATREAIDFDVAIKVHHQPVAEMCTMKDRKKASSNVFLDELQASCTLSKCSC